MRLPLDTRALLWWLDGDTSLSPAAREAIANESNEILLSAASAWEITTKYRVGKLPGAAAVAKDVVGCLVSQGFLELPITLLHGQTAGALPVRNAIPSIAC